MKKANEIKTCLCFISKNHNLNSLLLHRYLNVSVWVDMLTHTFPCCIHSVRLMLLGRS